MKLRILIATAICLLGGAALAQTAQVAKPIQIQPLQVQQAQAPDTQLESNLPEHKIAKLEAENRRLAEENVRLRQQHEEMTKLGGSQVRAYCPSREVSRNTAGAENDCASAGYNCEQVSGLCYSSCSSGEACAEGYNCDAGRCISGMPPSEE